MKTGFKTVISKIIVKFGLLSLVHVIFIIIIFGILTYIQSQQTLLGNTINIAGKNRYLTLNLLFEISEYMGNSPPPTSIDNNSNSQIRNAEQLLETNIMTLKNGGMISGVNLKPLPNDFLDSWNKVNSHWTDFKRLLNKELYDKRVPQSTDTNIEINQPAATNLDDSLKQELVPRAYKLVNSSDVLVTQIGQKVKNNWDNLIILQIIFGALIVVLILFILFMVRRLLNPITLLTRATSEIKKGNFDVSVDYKSGDELSELTESFNSMVSTIRNDVKKQSEMTYELTQLNQQLKENDRAKNEFISMISHELRTPLVPIRGYIEMLLKPEKTGILNEKQRKAVETIYRNEKKLESLVENILDIYKIDMGILILNKKEISISSLLNNVINDLKSAIEEKCASVVTEINTVAIKSVTCDEKRIEQVLSNLIKNSLDFVPNKAGNIILRVETLREQRNERDSIEYPGKNQLVFSVEDNGTGIPVDKMNKLFHKFYQIDLAITRKYGGTGLGLAICWDIIEAHGGKIWIDKEYRDGAAFRFTIPF
ncbi:HAMP domain-containing sensor histidine kinase [Candidatus Nitrosocosmicus arcticus]|uniref:histidine kinase n=1 Tax=Candidatus Nitrosocosmicus arcticus TaxID=2035267 RepID=A0A557SWQ6_9ARCH|nr:HAMP domain-containing sensor histidine kinase [Candidatus Nitrosocosmicus arcticus]TVP41047.1 putative Histidine kinase [Candidatus Nitrosocosmicus arcticus]